MTKTTKQATKRSGPGARPIYGVNMRMTSIRAPESLMENLTLAAQKLGSSRDALIRKILAEWLESQKSGLEVSAGKRK